MSIIRVLMKVDVHFLHQGYIGAGSIKKFGVNFYAYSDDEIS